jgi:hypothetical protein
VEQRLDRLEQASARHDEQIAKLFAQMGDMNVHLTAIQDTLNQIKYIAVGMIVYFTLQEFGFFAAFKAASKVVS